MRTKIFELRFLIPLIGLLLFGCNGEAAPITPEPTPVYQGPLVMSNNLDVIVEAWEYISPDDEEALTSFLSQDPDALSFGESYHEAHIKWYEGGFDLVWGNFPCSTEPILIIDKQVMTLWEEWTYTIHPETPLVGQTTYVPTPIPQEGAFIANHNPNVVVKESGYFSSSSELEIFLLQYPNVLPFGGGYHQNQIYITRRKGGFDLIWDRDICSTQTFLILGENTIELWFRDVIWGDCDGMIEGFRVEFETDFRLDEWKRLVRFCNETCVYYH